MQQSSPRIYDSTPPLLGLTNSLAPNLDPVSDTPLSERESEPEPALEVSIDLDPEIILTSSLRKVETISVETRKKSSEISDGVKDEGKLDANLADEIKATVDQKSRFSREHKKKALMAIITIGILFMIYCVV
jgi:hypothetical protein